MTDKERFDACIQEADFWTGRHDQRRQFEWKVTLGLWALILSGIAYREKLGTRPWWVWVLVASVSFLLYYRFWLYPLWRRNQQDRQQGFHYANQGVEILANANHQPTKIDYQTIDVAWTTFAMDWAQFFQAAATLLLLVLFVAAVWT